MACHSHLSQEGVTPLHYAAKSNNSDIATLLLERGGDPYAADKVREKWFELGALWY